MTAKVAYKKELYSLLSNVVEMSKNYVQETYKKKSHIVALLLFILLPSAANAKILQEKTNITNASTPIQSLTLTAPQTHYVKKREFDRPLYVLFKVVAKYKDGHSEEVTDRVKWIGLENAKGVYRDWFFATAGVYTFRASLDGVESNEVSVEVVNDTTPVQFDITYENSKNEISIDATIAGVLKEDVNLTISIDKNDKAAFPYYVNDIMKQSHTFEFKKGAEYNYKYTTIKVLDTNMTTPITVVTHPMQSKDADYNNVDLEDIVLSRVSDFTLVAPTLHERRGAIRGVTIKFAVWSNQHNLKYALVNPPKDMKIISRVYEGLRGEYGRAIEWHVPMDAQEGKIYDITLKATDPGTNGKEKSITFPIKVPKTKPIQTTLKNNELIVTDKSSPLFGMKMKGHSGEDISEMRLRSVEYGDVWKARGKGKHTVFVIYNKPPKLNIDLPGDLKNGLSKFRGAESVFFSSDVWKTLSPECVATEQWDGKSKFDEWLESHCKMQRNSDMYDNGGNIIYILHLGK